MGRTVGAVAAGVAAIVTARVVSSAVTSATSSTHWLMLAPVLAVVSVSVLRLLAWSVLWTRPRSTLPDGRVRATAEAALGATEVAVVCDGESLVLVRTATIAAIAATGSASRVLLVGSDPRLDQLARSLRVRRVSSGIGQRAGIAAAIAAAAGQYLVLTSAATAVLPGALRPALEQFDRGAAWVQSEPIGPGDRSLLAHVRHERWWPALDARGAMPWLGCGSIVLVEAFKTLPAARGASASTLTAQTRGWHGRWHAPMFAVEQADARTTRDREVDAGAERLRAMRSAQSPLWVRRLRPWQRIAHVAIVVDDLAGCAAALAITVVTFALATGVPPLPLEGWVWGAAVAVVLGWSARLLLTGGLVRPGGMCRAATDDLVRSVRSAASSLRRAPRLVEAAGNVAPKRGWRDQLGLLGLVAVVDATLAWRAWHVLTADGAGRDVALDGALLGVGVSTVLCLLSSARVVRRNRSLRAGRRLPVDVVARIGTHQGRVLDLSAGGLRVEFAAPADLLAELPVQLVARGLRPVEVRAQVVRVEPRANTWVLGMRLAGGGLAGEHDDYLALWLWQMAGAAEERPRLEPDPVVGRAPWRAGGVPVLRLLTATAMVAVGVAVVPPAEAGLTAGPATGETPAGVATTAVSTSEPFTEAEAEVEVEGDVEGGKGSGSGAEVDRTETGGTGVDEWSETTASRDRPVAVAGDLQLTTSVDDPDRLVEGGQVLRHSATLRNTGAVAVSTVDLSIVPGVGVVDLASLAGTCPGAATGTAGTDGPGTVGWTLLGTAGSLAPGAECTIDWSESLPAATELVDGSTVTTEVRVTGYAMAGWVGSRAGPAVTDELAVRRPTLRLTAESGDGTAVAAMTIGQAFTWVLTVENISPFAVTAHGVDLVHSLPKNWVYTATVSVTPTSCDVAPVVLVDEANASQTVAWTDMCDLDQGDELVLAFSATPQAAAADEPGLLDGAGEAVQHISDVTLTAEDLAGNPLGSASDTTAAVARTIDLLARVTDAGPDDGAADAGPAAVVGGLGRYRIDVANQGPDGTIDAVTTSLDVPDGMVAISAAGDGWTCTIGATVDCASPVPIASGGVAPPIVVGLAIGAGALVDDGADGDPDIAIVAATVTVGGGGGVDRDASNDVDGESTMVRRDVDVALSGALSIATPMSPGARVDWVLTPTVIGPAAISGELVVTDTMPVGIRFVSARGRGWTCNGSRVGTGFEVDPDVNGTLSCRRQLRDVDAGTALDALVVNVQIDPLFAGDAPAPGRVVIAGDRNPSNDAAATSGALAPEAELTVLAVTGGHRVQVGSDLTYEVVVTNQGPAADAGEVEVRAEVPAGLEVQTVAGEGWACETEPASDVSGGNWTCTWDGAVAPVVSGMLFPPIEVLATVTPAAVANLAPSVREPFTHEVVVRGSASGPEEINSQLSWTAEPTTKNTVSITDAGAGAWRVGQAHTVQVVVGNDGPNGEYGPATVQIPVTEAMDVISADGDGWDCGVTTRGNDPAADPDVIRTIECTHGRRGVDYGEPLVPAGGTLAPIDLSLVPAESRKITQQVRVIGVTDRSSHQSTAAVEVARRSDVALVVSGPSEARIGDEVELTWAVDNAGPSESISPLTITGALPPGVALVGAAGPNWSCDGNGAAVVCDRTEALADGESSTVALTVAIGRGTALEEIRVAATLRADPADASSDDDADHVTVRIRAGLETSPSTATTGSVETTVRSGVDAEIERELHAADALGYGGAAGSFAVAILLVSWRRRRGW